MSGMLKALGLSLAGVVKGFLPKDVLENLVGRDEAVLHGRCLGLTEDQIETVISATFDWHADSWKRGEFATADGVWTDAKARMTLLSMGLEWRP